MKWMHACAVWPTTVGFQRNLAHWPTRKTSQGVGMDTDRESTAVVTTHICVGPCVSARPCKSRLICTCTEKENHQQMPALWTRLPASVAAKRHRGVCISHAVGVAVQTLVQSNC